MEMRLFSQKWLYLEKKYYLCARKHIKEKKQKGKIVKND